ncbi:MULTISPECIES: YdaS family helix-turn-helix protein [Moraxella]|uniref:Uncharacterized protein conserved in bacteria, prophage-related n=1 Tax=Moraxella bovis TaxID=476 RepID=A0A1T0A238_MORBO|nr:YdaS family helix-turn-helix protein [Moraxella bovis]OOR89816.1 hypothetical protein B0182_06585 [Moraxella bovis]STY90181.1 Uncharacterized protein conserved in bacteria, prophage-related [Moraxella bovis]
MTTPLEALQKAVKIAGGRKQLAELIGCKHYTHIGIMLTRDKRASASYVLKISKATGVPPNELRPDLYEL